MSFNSATLKTVTLPPTAPGADWNLVVPTGVYWALVTGHLTKLINGGSYTGAELRMDNTSGANRAGNTEIWACACPVQSGETGGFEEHLITASAAPPPVACAVIVNGAFSYSIPRLALPPGWGWSSNGVDPKATWTNMLFTVLEITNSGNAEQPLWLP